LAERFFPLETAALADLGDLRPFERSGTGSASTFESPCLPLLQQPDADLSHDTRWQDGLPELAGLRLTLRELRREDAESLFEQLTTEEVTRFISPPPTSVDGFRQFIDWAHKRRSQGRYACFAVVPEGETQAVGMFQIHLHDPASRTAEWGFVLGSSYWGRGLFLEGAMLVLEFAFERLGIRRLEARACVDNLRGVGALRKVGAVCERIVERSFERLGRRFDQSLWVVRAEWWRASTVPWGKGVQ
jgi:ribosomal-protein-alanine N-acetyltransferase